jgi:hypothetical protein
VGLVEGDDRVRVSRVLRQAELPEVGVGHHVAPYSGRPSSLAHDFADVPAVFAAVKPGGAFTATTTIPRAKPAGTYTITGRCGGGNLGVSATLVVRAAASPTTTAAPVPPATGPSVIQPAVPAPAVTGPATPPASRWIIPGLAALGSSTLAALAMWLLYRRRHPASLSRQGRSCTAN